jgi:hypothetical protein
MWNYCTKYFDEGEKSYTSSAVHVRVYSVANFSTWYENVCENI